MHSKPGTLVGTDHGGKMKKKRKKRKNIYIYIS